MARITYDTYDNNQLAHYGNQHNAADSYRPRVNGGFALLAIVMLLLMVLLFWTDPLWLRRNLNAVTTPAVQVLSTTPLTDIRYVIASNLKLREEPDSAARTSYLLPRGTKVALLGEAQQEPNGTVWLRVEAETRAGTQVGWVQQTWLKRNLDTVSRPPVQAVQGSSTRPLTNIRHVTVDDLELRDEPSHEARASYLLPRRTKVVLLGELQPDLNGEFWLRVSVATSAGTQVGWVSQQYVE